MVRHGSRSRRCCWALVVLMAVAGCPAQRAVAQTPEIPPDEPPTFELPEVIVPGKRPQTPASTPASVSVLTREDLDRLGVATVGEALQFVAETHVRLQGGLGALSLLSIRGSSPNQVLVLIDGIPVTSVMQGLFDLSTLSLAAVERVEILRGPFSALYGGSALGGVVNVVTTADPDRRWGVRSGGLAATGVTGRWSTADGRMMVAADQFASTGSRPNSDVAATTFLARAAWETAAGGSVVLAANHFQSTLGVPGSTAFPSPQARQDEVRTIASAHWHRDTGGGQWVVDTYAWRDTFRFVDPATAVDSQVATQVVGAAVQRTMQRGAGHVRVYGAEGQVQALEHNGPVGARQAAVGGLYFQDERQISPRTLLSAGIRYDLHSVYGGQLNPRLGIVSVLRDGLTLRAGLGRTFRGPAFSELYFAPFNNPALRPESAWSADAGLAWRSARGIEVRAGLFATAATDLIRPDPSFVPQNLGRVTMTGGSLEVTARSLAGLRSAFNITVTRAADDSTGAQFLRVPWVTASAVLQRPLAAGVLTALATYVGSRPDSDPATFAPVILPGVVVAGLRFRWGTPAMGQWQIGVDNLTDLRYEPVAGYPAPGRTAFIAFARSY